MAEVATSAAAEAISVEADGASAPAVGTTELPSLRSESERLKLERDNAQLRAELAALGKPWWRKGSIVTTLTAIVAAVVPLTTAVSAHYQKEREIALQEVKQKHEIRTSFLDRLDKPGARMRTLRFVLATSDDQAMKTWALEGIQVEESAEQAQEQVEKLSRDSNDLNERLSVAEQALRTGQTDAERIAAQTGLDRLRQQKYEMEKRMQEARDAAAKAERVKGMHISRECLENPLAKGCS